MRRLSPDPAQMERERTVTKFPELFRLLPQQQQEACLVRKVLWP